MTKSPHALWGLCFMPLFRVMMHSSQHTNLRDDMSNATIKRINGIIARDTQRLALWPTHEHAAKWAAHIEQCKAQLAAIGE